MKRSLIKNHLYNIPCNFPSTHLSPSCRRPQEVRAVPYSPEGISPSKVNWFNLHLSWDSEECSDGKWDSGGRWIDIQPKVEPGDIYYSFVYEAKILLVETLIVNNDRFQKHFCSNKSKGNNDSYCLARVEFRFKKLTNKWNTDQEITTINPVGT